jgi:predicted alpha/beta superfamily hydrolase
VAGEFNGWDAAATPMTALAGDIYWAKLPIDTGPNRYLYKITDGASWMADPMARRFGYDTYGEYSLVSGGIDQGHLERHVGIAGYGLPSRPLTIYLPPGYETSSADFPVLYAHDGQNLFDPLAMSGGWHLDQTIEDLLQQGVVQPFIVVGIHNTSARMDEYTHVQDVLSGQTIGGKGDAYYDLVRTRVMPLVEGHYRVRTGPESTWTMGSSLGGLIALYFGMKHPDVFGRVAGMSSTLGWGSIGANNPTLMDLLASMNHPAVVFYLDSGGDDGGPPGCVDSDSDGVLDDAPASSDNYCETVQMRDALVSDGYVYDVDLVHWHEPGAPHNEAAWGARVGWPLEVLAAP